MTVVGPAYFLFQFSQNGEIEIKFDYGKLFVKSEQLAPETSVIVGLESERYKLTNGAMISVSRGPGANKFEFLNLGTNSLSLESGEEISVGQMGLVAENEIYRSQKNDSDLKNEKRLFIKLRNLLSTEPTDTEKDSVTEVASLKKFIEGGVFFGFTRLRPLSSGSTFLQDLGGMGGYLKKGRNSYFGFPLDPLKVTRNHYLYAPSIRWGWGLYYASFWIEPIVGFPLKAQSLVPHIFLGWGWEGINIDLLVGPSLDFGRLTNSEFKLRWPVGTGFDVNYRIDVAKVMDSEMGIIVGLRYLLGAYTRNSQKASITADLVVPQSFFTHTYSFQTGLNFRF
jgi:hypothetical protein